jgi:hypothetical protein
MSVQFDNAFNHKYTGLLELQLQQKGSKLRNHVRVESFQGNKAQMVQQLGSVTAYDVTSRHADTQYITTPHDSRWIHPHSAAVADIIDTEDKLRSLIDATPQYASNFALALGRKMDARILNGALETNYTGQAGTTSTAFDTTNQRISSGSTGLTGAKLRQALEILMAAHVDVDSDQLCVAVTAKQYNNLMAETTAVSRDFNGGQPVLVDGILRKYCGFNIVHCQELGLDGSNARRCVAWAKSGLVLGVWNDITTTIDRLPTKNNSTQVLSKMTIGAARTEEGKIVEILCTE